jgi:hypothetical protein
MRRLKLVSWFFVVSGLALLIYVFQYFTVNDHYNSLISGLTLIGAVLGFSGALLIAVQEKREMKEQNTELVKA